MGFSLNLPLVFRTFLHIGLQRKQINNNTKTVVSTPSVDDRSSATFGEKLLISSVNTLMCLAFPWLTWETLKVILSVWFSKVTSRFGIVKIFSSNDSVFG